jgi:hypothetical protein
MHCALTGCASGACRKAARAREADALGKTPSSLDMSATRGRAPALLRHSCTHIGGLAHAFSTRIRIDTGQARWRTECHERPSFCRRLTASFRAAALAASRRLANDPLVSDQGHPKQSRLRGCGPCNGIATAAMYIGRYYVDEGSVSKW